MRRTKIPYAGSVLVGILLGIGLFLFLNSRLQPPVATLPFENSETGRPEAVATGEGRGQAARAIAEETESPPPAPPLDAAQAVAPPITAPTTAPTVAEAGPRFMIGVGPLTEHGRAMAVVRQVVVAGFDASVTTKQVPHRFTVTSATVSLTLARRRMTALAYLGLRPRLLRVNNRSARLHFGSFARRSDAEALARRVRATGYSSAAVGRNGGNTYIITIGPHRRETTDVVSGLLRTRFRGVPVTVNPVN